jgi:hypothetical protein
LNNIYANIEERAKARFVYRLFVLGTPSCYVLRSTMDAYGLKSKDE